jgi:hypothetical protein
LHGSTRALDEAAPIDETMNGAHLNLDIHGILTDALPIGRDAW